MPVGQRRAQQPGRPLDGGARRLHARRDHGGDGGHDPLVARLQRVEDRRMGVGLAPQQVRQHGRRGEFLVEHGDRAPQVGREVAGPHGHRTTRRQALDQRFQQVGFAREVVVDEPLRHPGLLRDPRRRRRREAVLREQRLGGGEDALARGLVVHRDECRTCRTAGATRASAVLRSAMLCGQCCAVSAVRPAGVPHSQQARPRRPRSPRGRLRPRRSTTPRRGRCRPAPTAR